MKRFEAIDHPSDIGIIAYGKDLKELFENAAFGMFSLMGDIEAVTPEVEKEFKTSGSDKESLLINWLNELIFTEDTKKIMFKDFKVLSLSDKSLTAKAFGCRAPSSKPLISRSIKGATFNQLEIKKIKSGLSARIVFDV